MELRQLEYLVTVADERSFTRAASRLHVAQPGISAQVRKLEAQLGHELLVRSPRTVTPTAVGEAVLVHARAALAAVNGIGEAIDALTGLVRGRLSIGTISSWPALAPVLGDFHARHPQVRLELREDLSEPLLADLLAGRVDVLFIGLPDPAPDGLGRRVVLEERLVAVVAHDHPLASRRRLRFSELAGHPLVAMPPTTRLRGLVEDACARSGIAPDVRFEGGAPPMLADLAGRGLGVAVVPESVVASRRDSIVAITLERPSVVARIELCWRDDGSLSPAARAFVEHASAALGAS